MHNRNNLCTGHPTLIRRFLPRCCRHCLRSRGRQIGRQTRLKTVDCREEGPRSLTSAARKPLINTAATCWASSTKLKPRGSNLSIQLPQLDHGAPGARRDLLFKKPSRIRVSWGINNLSILTDSLPVRFRDRRPSPIPRYGCSRSSPEGTASSRPPPPRPTAPLPPLWRPCPLQRPRKRRGRPRKLRRTCPETSGRRAWIKQEIS